jgi:hypothetical protein
MAVEGLQINRGSTGIGWAEAVNMYQGTADPNGSVTAAIGSVYFRSGSGAQDLIYRNLDGGTTWIAVAGGGSGVAGVLTVYVATTGSDSNTGLTQLAPMRTLAAAIARYYVRGRALTVLLEARGTYTTDDFGLFSDLVNVTVSTYNAITPEVVTIAAEVQAATDSQVAIVDVTGFARSWALEELVGSAFVFDNTGRIGWVVRNTATVAGVTQLTITSGDSATALNATTPGTTLSFYTNAAGETRGRHATIMGPDANFGFRQSSRLLFEWIAFRPELATPRALILEATQARFDHCYFGATIQRVGTFLYSNFLWLVNSYVACGNTSTNFGLISPGGPADTIRIDAGSVLDGIHATAQIGIQANVMGDGGILLLQGRTIAQELSTVYNLTNYSANVVGTSAALVSFVLSNQQGGTAVARVADLRSTDGVAYTVLPAIRGSTVSTWAVVAARNAPLVRLDPFFSVVDANTAEVNRISADGGGSACTGDAQLQTRVLRDAGLAPITPVLGANVTLNGITGDAFNVDLSPATGNVTINLVNPVKFSTIFVRFTQGAVARSIVSWNGGVSVQWAGGAPGALTAAPNAVDVFELYHDGTQYIGRSYAANVS